MWSWLDRCLRAGIMIFMVGATWTVVDDRLAADASAVTGASLYESSELARASTARLSATTCDGFARGTAFAVDGAMVTNEHLVSGATTARLDDGTHSVERDVLAGRAGLDTATLAETGLPPLQLASEVPDRGAPVVVAGHPSGGDLEIRSGTVHLLTDGPAYGFDVPVLLLDVVTGEGFSGGPVLDASGEVVGMLAAVDDITGLAIAIPVTALDGWLASDGGTVPIPCPGQLSD